MVSLVLCALMLVLTTWSIARGQGVDDYDHEDDEPDATCKADGTCDSNECIDEDSRCLFWAQGGECVNNPVYMARSCQQSCELCVGKEWLLPWDVHLDCEDAHPNCERWQAEGECIKNPSFMKKTCKQSCKICINRNKVLEEGADDDEILRHFRYSEADWGADQSLGTTDAEKSKLYGLVVAMDDYAFHNVTTYPLAKRILCMNSRPDCISRAFDDECENNLAFMMMECPLACRLCDKRDRYELCKDVEPTNPWVLADGLQLKLKHLQRQGQPELVYEGKEPDDPWILKWDDFLSSREADDLLALAKSLSWKESTPVAPMGLKEVHNVRRQSKSAFSADCNDGAYQKLQKDLLSLLDTDLSYIEPFEFVHYRKMQSFGMHHDVPLHDLWMPAGPRVLSIFLCLTDVPDGGAMGFPNLDWLMVPPKKGQLLVWSNVLNSDPRKRNAAMMSESLPVIEGDKYGIHTWVRLYNYSQAEAMGCV